MQWDEVSLRPVTSCCLRACALSQAWRRVTLPFLTCVFVCVVPFFLSVSCAFRVTVESHRRTGI